MDLCNPKNFLDPYQPDKLKISTDLYSSLRDNESVYDKLVIRKIRIIADESLGIKLPSKDTYEIMKSIFNPANFVDDKFDKKRLIASSEAYKYINDNKDDLRKLEQFAYQIGLLEKYKLSKIYHESKGFYHSYSAD